MQDIPYQDEARKTWRLSSSGVNSETSKSSWGAQGEYAIEEEFRNGKRYRMVLIELEEAHVEQLRQPFSAPWGLEDDQLLVRFLRDSCDKLNGSHCKVLYILDPFAPRWRYAKC